MLGIAIIVEGGYQEDVTSGPTAVEAPARPTPPPIPTVGAGPKIQAWESEVVSRPACLDPVGPLCKSEDAGKWV